MAGVAIALAATVEGVITVVAGLRPIVVERVAEREYAAVVAKPALFEAVLMLAERAPTLVMPDCVQRRIAAEAHLAVVAARTVVADAAKR